MFPLTGLGRMESSVLLLFGCGLEGRDLIRPGLRKSVKPLRNDMGTLRETSLRV